MKNSFEAQRSRYGRTLVSILAVVLLVMALVTPALAQRGSFGRSGGFGRSSGSFGRSSGSFGRSSGGFFGRSGSTQTVPRPSYGNGSSNYRAPGSSSFGRSGSFGNSGRINSTSLGDRFNPPPSYQGIPYSTRTTVNYGGTSVPAFGYGFLGGFSLGMLASPWTHWLPFHPAFYVDPPVYHNGAYYAGGFSFFRLILGVVILWLVIRFFSRLRGGGRGGNGGSGFGGGRRIKYTVYR